MSVLEIQNAAANLAEQDRASLAAWLLDSLPSPGNAEDTEALQEATRRREELDSGTVKPMNSTEFWASLREAQT